MTEYTQWCEEIAEIFNISQVQYQHFLWLSKTTIIFIFSLFFRSYFFNFATLTSSHLLHRDTVSGVMSRLTPSIGPTVGTCNPYLSQTSILY